MSMSKADERFLACLDRALQYHAMRTSAVDRLPDPDVIVETAQEFYRALPTIHHYTAVNAEQESAP